MATPCFLIGRGGRRRQPGKETRKCNSGRLSEYDVPGSRSILSQTLERRAGWHGGSRGYNCELTACQPLHILLGGGGGWGDDGEGAEEEEVSSRKMRMEINIVSCPQCSDKPGRLPKINKI